MSLDVWLQEIALTDVYQANITHNLFRMANEAGIGECLWEPEKIGLTTAKELIPMLREGLKKMKADPERFKEYDAENGWGTYKDFVPWIEKYLAACEAHPEALVKVSR